MIFGPRVTSTLPSSGYWPPFVINGAAIDLGHLEPLLVACPTPGQLTDLWINVRFSMHCFTEGFDPLRHDPSLKVMDHKKPRAFDPRRYNLSKNLPALIRALPTAKVHQTPEQRNYLYFCVLAELAGEEYLVFFSMKKAHKGQDHHLELFVESAYPARAGATPSRKRPNAIRFAILALKVYKGEPVRFAAR
jgi:hypothetical protein